MAIFFAYTSLHFLLNACESRHDGIPALFWEPSKAWDAAQRLFNSFNISIFLYLFPEEPNLAK